MTDEVMIRRNGNFENWSLYAFYIVYSSAVWFYSWNYEIVWDPDEKYVLSPCQAFRRNCFYLDTFLANVGLFFPDCMEKILFAFFPKHDSLAVIRRSVGP